MEPDRSRHWLVSFFTAAAISAVSACTAWIAFSLLTAMMNPKLAGLEYWSAVLDRAGREPAISAMLLISILGVVAGVIWMCLAIKRRDRDVTTSPDSSQATPADTSRTWR